VEAWSRNGWVFFDGRGVRFRLCGDQSKQMCVGGNNTCLSIRNNKKNGNLCVGHFTGFKKYRLEGLKKGDIMIINGQRRKFNGFQRVKMCNTEGCDTTVAVRGMCQKHSPVWRCQFTGSPCKSIRVDGTDYCRVHRENVQNPVEKSKGELAVAKVLTAAGIKYVANKAITTQQNKILYPDFYIPDLNAVIEFDGKQHFIPVEYWGGADFLARQTINDLRKDTWINMANLRMLRIPHDEIGNVETHVNTFLALLADPEGLEDQKIFSPAHPVYVARGYCII